MAGKTYTLGPLEFTDTDTVRFRRLKLTGWDEPAGSNLALQQNPRGPGAWRANTPQRTARVLVLSGMLQTSTIDDMQAVVDQLNDAYGLDDVKLTVGFGSTSRWAMVSMQDQPAYTPYPTALVRDFSIQLVAEDPRKFEDAMQASTFLPSSSGGLTAPFTAPFTVDAVQVSGRCSLVNPGNEVGPVVARIDGPCTGITSITHLTTDSTLTFAEDLDLSAGEFLVIDMEARTVLAQGVAPRSGWVTQRGFSGFDPGVNEWAFASEGLDVGAKLSITATPAYK